MTSQLTFRQIISVGLLTAWTTCQPLAGQDLRISEFVASNSTGLQDEDGDEVDWIEIFNEGEVTINLKGWHLTDDATDLRKWTFPSFELAPGQFLVVFASDKDRKNQSGYFHTNFKLSAGGEYLALVQSDGTTIASDFAPSYPPQITDVSYGWAQNGETTKLVDMDARVRYLVPVNGNDDVANGANVNSWITTDFDDSSWLEGTNGLGYTRDNNDPYDAFIETDLEDLMFNRQTTVYVRIPFTVENAAVLSSLQLLMNYDDGFVAYLNGDPLPVAEANSPSPAVLAFDSQATATNPENAAIVEELFPLFTTLINTGENVLSFHFLNRTADASDALFLPQLQALVPNGEVTKSYLNEPTPGGVNQNGVKELGPYFGAVTEEVEPLNPADQLLLIEAEVGVTLNPILSVVLIWRKMYEAGIALPMLDDGSGGDRTPNDGIYSATIPIDHLSPGEMLRWKIAATDDAGNVSHSPGFTDPEDSDEFYGTIAGDPSINSSDLPVIHWFIKSPSKADTVSGTRSSFYYMGEFYDNIQSDVHGQSTRSFPKKSYDIDFNKGNRFLPYDGGMKAKDINLLTNWADKSKTRNTLGYEMMRMSGHPGHYAFPVRIQQNGAFFSTADLVEDGDDRYLERVGLDQDGALYKMNNSLDSPTSGVDKKTRKGENNADLAGLISGLDQTGGTWLEYGYDNVNIPGTINYLASLFLTNNRDNGNKNYYLYRDTNGTGEWRPLVWDIDLCLGRNYSSLGYFDDEFTNSRLHGGPKNRLKELIFNDETLDSMYRRRIRTLMEKMLGSPTEPVDYLPTRVNELAALVDPTDDDPTIGADAADLDYQKWGSWGNLNAMRPAAQRILDEHLPSRRWQLYNDDEIPSAQPNLPAIVIEMVEFNPASSGASPDQSGEYLLLRNNSNIEVDCSDWTLSGGIQMTLPPGAIIPRNGEMFVGRDAVGFRSRTISPKANEKNYLISGYDGQLSARGETITLSDAQGVVIDSETYPGAPTPGQVGLRVAELLYAPAPPTAVELAALPGLSASDFEYIELINVGNTTLDLGGARFIEGVAMTFAAGIELAPGDRILVVSNAAAFALRCGAGCPVAGEFTGQLSNGGEQLQIVDPVGENILEFTYGADWFPQAHQDGHSMVVISPGATPVTDFDQAANWQPSQFPNGTPGAGPSSTASNYVEWKNAVFSSSELLDVAISGDEADHDGDGKGTLVEYAFVGSPHYRDAKKASHTSTREIEGADHLVFSYRSRPAATDLEYNVQITYDLKTWFTVLTSDSGPISNFDGSLTHFVRDPLPMTPGSTTYFRVLVTYSPPQGTE